MTSDKAIFIFYSRDTVIDIKQTIESTISKVYLKSDNVFGILFPGQVDVAKLALAERFADVEFI